ncbi:hypothetical protein TW84_19625 [Vibrio neptunius]|uniref:hypothetical protein n=1 Tax=Vibrio neptunius TaxID=170651 RepID=UPI0005FA16AC|nr:hypothetical protein [Vibrio neptunius]KJY86598.1 hypothetical protein TW84_19625 [Vibrio neptunius]
MASVSELFEQHLLSQSPESNTFWGYAIPLIEKLQQDGVSFFFRSDGERKSNVYTIIVEGKPMNGDYIRCETDLLERGIEQVLSEYAKDYWN